MKENIQFKSSKEKNLKYFKPDGESFKILEILQISTHITKTKNVVNYETILILNKY